MKRFVVLMLFIILTSSLVFGAGSGGAGGVPPTDVDGKTTVTGSDAQAPGADETAKPDTAGNPEDAGAGEQVVLANRGDEEQNRIETQAQQGAAQGQQVREQVQARVEERKQELDQEAASKSEKEQKVLRNQNAVRLAVHALLEMKDDIGGIGQNVSTIARDFNNSIQATIRAETRVEERSGFKRFFAGGDEEAADEIEAEVTGNREKIQELTRLHDSCPCDEETKALLQEQITTMEREQARLGELAAKEKKSKGLFGWLWK